MFYLIKGPDTQEIVQNKTNEKRCLCAEDVQFSYQLPGKGTVVYWVATVSSSDFNIDKVIAKSVSGEYILTVFSNMNTSLENTALLRKVNLKTREHQVFKCLAFFCVC